MRPPASTEQIAEWRAMVKDTLELRDLPEDLCAVLSRSNGFVGNEVVFYSIDESLEQNRLLEVLEFAPGHVAIACDGGSRVALLDTNRGGSEVLLNDMGDMKSNSMEPTGMSLFKWVEAGCPFRLEPIPRYAAVEKTIVRLDKMPAEGLAALMRIRNELNLDVSVSRLKERCKDLPCHLCQLSYVRAIRAAAKLNEREKCISLWRAADPTEPLPLE